MLQCVARGFLAICGVLIICVLQCAAVCVLQCVAVCCSVLQCGHGVQCVLQCVLQVCCSATQYDSL